MRPSMPDLRWSPLSVEADSALVAHVAVHHSGSISVGRLCARCGSAAHGRPWARADGVDVPVSLARAGDFLVTAVGKPGVRGLGVDVEALDPERQWPLEVMLGPGEAAPDGLSAARIWVAKEAILKVDGVGLDHPMSALRVADFDGVLWEVAAPPGYVAAVALRR